MIACSPKIVISPTPTTGLPANSFASPSSDNLFSTALQAATHNLLHPSLKSQVGMANPAQQKSPTLNVKTASTSGNPFSQNLSLQPQGATNAAAETNSMPVQVLPAQVLPVQDLPVSAVAVLPTAAPLQPTTVGEAKLQAATLGAEQNQSATQIARVATVATSAQATPSATTGFQQFLPVSPQFGSGTTGITDASTAVLPGPQTTPLSSAVPELPQAHTEGTPPTASQPPKPQPLSGLDLLSVAAGKREATPVQPESQNASSAPASQAGLPAHSTKPASQPVPATPQPAGNATPPATATRSLANQPEHSGVTTESKNQTTPAAGVGAVADSSAPPIPPQVVTPDINVTKVSPKPAEALQAAPALTGSPSGNATQPAMEISKKNGDASGSGNSQSGTGNGSTSSFSPTTASSQTADTSVVPPAKLADASSSIAVVGTQAAHAVASTNDAPGTSAKPDVPAAEALHSPGAGTMGADARVQAAATYANSLLHSARLVERVGQSELRVGIQAGEFGNVDIRTSMVRNQFTAQISVERGELGKVLAAELPSLQNKLSEQRLPVANITLQNQSSGGSAGFGQGSRQSQTMQQIVIPQSSEAEPAPTFMGLADASISTERLDVHM